MQKYLIWFLIFLGYTAESQAQSNINIKFFGLSVHPRGDANAELMPLNLDNKGIAVLNLGGSLAYEHFINPDKFSVKVIQAVYADCAAQLGGFSHIGVRWVIFKKGRHSLNGGLGPTLVYRRNWYTLADYKDSGYFNGKPHDKWQYKFIPYAGEFEYNIAITDKLDLSTTFVPGYPDLISLSVGVRCWLKPKQKQTDSPADKPVTRL